VVDKVAQEQVFLQVLYSFPVSTPLMPHRHINLPQTPCDLSNWCATKQHTSCRYSGTSRKSVGRKWRRFSGCSWSDVTMQSDPYACRQTSHYLCTMTTSISSHRTHFGFLT